MANATVNLPVTKANYLKESEPYTVIKANSSTEYYVDYEPNSTNERKMLFGISSMPTNLRHNVLVGCSFTLGLKNTYSGESYVVVQIVPDFDEDIANYNNAGTSGTSFATMRISAGATSIRNITSETQTAYKAKQVTERKALRVQCGDVLRNNVSTKTVLANGTTKPYVTIVYDDATKIKSKVQYEYSQLSDKISIAEEKTLTWELVKDTSAVSGYCADETWDQASAVFKYRIQGGSAWQTITVSGNTKSVTIPAYTFLTGASYEYQIDVTDEDGTTSSTSVYTFATATTQVTPSNAPTSGYANPRNPISFGWTYQSAAGGTVSPGATTLYWRVSGAETWTAVQAAAGANSLTIPANTFPAASTIQWYLSGTDATGYASQTSVYSFSTAAGAVTATAVSPSNTVQSNNQAITFNWNFSSSDGFAPSRYKFMRKLATDAEYTTLLDETTIVTEYTFPAYTFPAGEIQWMIIPYNIDGVEGTGQATTFICYGAPEAPVVYVENTPFTTVRWQANDQQAYQIRVDDTVYGPYFGTEKTFELPDKLEDGEHSISVSIVGTYGLWSDWGTSVINVQNAPGEEIVLTGVSGIDNMLSWETEEATADFLIFRDGVQIGHTARTTFADRYASGEHSYQVLNRLTDGNYSESNTVTLETTAAGTYITERVGGEWLEIKYSKMDMRDPDYEETADGTFYHLAGNTYPSGSLSGFRESKVNFSALFLAEQETDRKRFESLLGKEVILKFRDGTVFPTILNNWTKELKKLSWTTYSFALQRIETEDYVDDTT